MLDKYKIHLPEHATTDNINKLVNMIINVIIRKSS